MEGINIEIFLNKKRKAKDDGQNREKHISENKKKQLKGYEKSCHKNLKQDEFLLCN